VKDNCRLRVTSPVSVLLPTACCYGSNLDADGGAQYKREFADAVHQVIAPSLSSDCADRVRSAEKDTVVYPLIQMGPVNVTVDERVTSRLFRDAPSAATLYLASGYFNLTDTYQQSIVDQCAATFSILSAAPEVV